MSCSNNCSNCPNNTDGNTPENGAGEVDTTNTVDTAPEVATESPDADETVAVIVDSTETTTEITPDAATTTTTTVHAGYAEYGDPVAGTPLPEVAAPESLYTGVDDPRLIEQARANLVRRFPALTDNDLDNLEGNEAVRILNGDPEPTE